MSAALRFGVIGSGAWGTALAILANRAGSDVCLWTRSESIKEMIEQRRTNDVYLPDIFIEPSIEVTTDLRTACAADALILAVPAQSLRSLCISLSDLLQPETPLIIACKGIERGSLALMSEVVNATLPANPVMVLSGPNFANEAAKGVPTATVLAATERDEAERVRFALGGKYFRPYLSDDVIGVQIGGAIKNVIAIACGVANGMGYGENARAALVTRGLAEMIRLAEVRGGKRETLTGLSGFGDLMLSCCSRTSRNMALGYGIGSGKEGLEAVKAQSHGLTEGVATAESVYQMALKLGVSMPISMTVHEVLTGILTVEEGIKALLSRPFASE
ncbi:MAG: NAD(P)H-dependent glycerol-3-phosphate dehydrogenase [Rickettsiales bacterium]